MAIRGARMLIAGACSSSGQRLVEAFLALGAQVVAADVLRTRLEALRAGLRQHERLWVAESDLGDLDAARALFRDVGREPIDAAVLVIESAGELDAASGDAQRVREALGGIERCGWFARAAAEAAGRHGGGRALIAIEPAQGGVDRAIAAAVAELVAAPADRDGLALSGLAADLTGPGALERVVALCDPARPAARGWLPAP